MLDHHSGDFGPHTLRDLPGVRSTYVDDQLDRMHVRAPVVHAHPTSNGRGRQLVGWRYRIESSTDGKGWHVLCTSDLQTAAVVDGRPARFRGRVHRLDSVSWLREYRVCIEMVWFRPGDTAIAGMAEHRVEWYELLGVPVAGPVPGSCRGELFRD